MSSIYKHSNYATYFRRLSAIAGMNVLEARQWLEELPGIGPKTSAAVISFSNLHRKALPVDSHHFSVAWRLGIIEERLGEAKTNRVLVSILPINFTAQDVYDHRQVMRHWQKICFHILLDCKVCTLLDICPVGQLF